MKNDEYTGKQWSCAEHELLPFEQIATIPTL
jgi:hypothetical protein